MSTNTPGPWRLSRSYSAIVADFPTGFDDELNVTSYGGHLIAESVRMPANANLIIAAPDMIDALRQWAYAEANGDADELANARKSRDLAIMKATQGDDR